MGKQKSYQKATVTSKDGTIIGYRQLGKGPGLILVHGGFKSSQDFMKLAGILSEKFTVYVVDRRGRGFSPYIADDTFTGMRVTQETEDLEALVAKTGAANIFALSAGALVALHTALATPTIQNVAVYEPPLSVHGSVPVAWVARYEREVASGKLANAIVSGMHGLATVPLFTKIPRFLLVPMLSIVMMLQGKATEEEVTIRSLVPTWEYDMKIVNEMSDTAEDYRNLQANVLLLGGTKSPKWLSISLEKLSDVLPHARRITYPGLGHDGPEDDGNPGIVAKDLESFFASEPLV